MRKLVAGCWLLVIGYWVLALREVEGWDFGFGGTDEAKLYRHWK